MIIADTSVWIKYFREPESQDGRELDSLLRERQVIMVGVVIAEMLQGARSHEELSTLSSLLQDAPCIEASRTTWLRAGEVSMQLRRQGIVIPLTDLLIAGLAQERGHEVYALDQHFQRIPGVTLHQVGG